MTRSSSRFPSAGFTLLEVLILLAVIGVLALIAIPRWACVIQKKQLDRVLENMTIVRNKIEAYEGELGWFPGSLEELYPDSTPPPDIRYCAFRYSNSGSGSEDCANFSGNNRPDPGEAPSDWTYLLVSTLDLAPCQDVDFAWLTCCGMAPQTVAYDEQVDVPGIGNPRGGGGGGQGGPGG